MEQSFLSYEAAPLVFVTRGAIVESWHRGHVAVVDGRGETIAQLGDPQAVTYLRSASKPQQALPLITSGAADRFGFTQAELALVCGSHNGDAVHTETVRAMLAKTGLDETALQCGSHEPYGTDTARRMREAGIAPTAIHNNCSGKHAGMLALARHSGAPLETYLRPEHPVQQAAARAVAQFSGVSTADLAIGLDGCGVPTFGVSVHAMALMYARLLHPPTAWDEDTRRATARLRDAMIAHPEMVGGLTDSLDTALMRATRGRILAKAGAEGVFTAAVFPDEKWPRGLAIAFKIEDGDGARRVRRPVALELLKQLDALQEEEAGKLREYQENAIYNRRGELAGEAKTAFALQFLA
jgi:L-asparaginase II